MQRGGGGEEREPMDKGGGDRKREMGKWISPPLAAPFALKKG